MSVRITRAIDGERTVLQVAGRLESADLSELDKEIRSLDGPFVLDLSELLSADERGIERLGELAAGAAELRGASGYVQMLLDS
jgi:hypothetical protein